MFLLRCACALLVSALVVVAQAAPRQITLAGGEWQPYQCKTMRHGGFVGHLVKEAFALQGFSVTVEYFPWKRSYEMTRSGKVDGSYLWRYSDERAESFHFSDPLITTDAVMFHRKDLDFSWKNDASLIGFRIGGTIGYHYEFAAIPGIDIDWVDSDHTNMKKLIHGRIDLFADDRRVGYHLLRTRFPKAQANLITHSVWQEGAPISYHLVLPRSKADSTVLLEKFNLGLAQLKASGRYDAILAAQERGEYRRVQPRRRPVEHAHHP